MKERPNIAVEEDTEEMRKWRSLNQSEMDLCWKNLGERMEEEVLDKYKVEKSERGAFKGKSTQKQEIQNLKVVRRLLGKIFSLFGEYNLQRLQSKQEESTEEEESSFRDEAAAKGGYHERSDKENRIKRMDAQK